MSGPFRPKKDLFRKALLPKEKFVLSRRQAGDRGTLLNFLLLALWFLFGMTVLYLLFLSSLLRVTNIEFQGESLVPKERLETFTQGILRGKYFHIIPKDNLLLSPRRSLENALLREFPKFQFVTVTPIFPHQLKVSLTEAPYLVRWCTAGPCFLVSPEVKIQSSMRAEDPLYAGALLSIIDRSGAPFFFGEDGERKQYVDTFLFLKEHFPEKTGLTLSQEAETPSRFANELQFKTSAGWTLLVNTETAPDETLAAAEGILAALSDEKKKELQSLDLRIEGRAFLGSRGEEEEVQVAGGEVTPDVPAEKPKDKNKKKKD